MNKISQTHWLSNKNTSTEEQPLSPDFDSARFHTPTYTAITKPGAQLRKFLNAEVAPYIDDGEENGKINPLFGLKQLKLARYS